MFKLPLTDAQFARYQEQLREMEEYAASLKLKGLKGQPNRNKTGKLFGHLSPEIAEKARANLARYMADPKHAEKLASTGTKRGALYASLVAAAIARAKYPDGKMTKEFHKYCRNRHKWKNKLKKALGLKDTAPYIRKEYNVGGAKHYKPEMVIALEEQKVNRVHANHGEPPKAEQSSTDMAGI